MADDVEMIPVAGAEPPKADPLAKPAATLKLNPVARKPVIGGAPSAGLKPGLKLPPKPGLASGLKLPPKPGAASPFKPGLKLPTQAALKPGIKLPPKPVIHKPGEAVAAAPLPKPVEMPKPMEALKSVTQKLKGITQEIPQQAVLHKTGIIAESGLSDAQKEAAKHKTARISLSDAMGVAPVKDEAAPMKTIRIKRPIDIPTSTPPAAPAAAAPAAAPAAPAPAAPAAAAPAAAPAPTVTQRKTLKVARPSGVAVRPGGKFSIKRPGQTATIGQATTIAKAAAAPAAPAADGAVADIPDLPATAAAPVPHAAPAEAESPSWVWTLSAIVQLAACAVIGALAWFLYQNTQLATFCGGLGWGA